MNSRQAIAEFRRIVELHEQYRKNPETIDNETILALINLGQERYIKTTYKDIPLSQEIDQTVINAHEDISALIKYNDIDPQNIENYTYGKEYSLPEDYLFYINARISNTRSLLYKTEEEFQTIVTLIPEIKINDIIITPFNKPLLPQPHLVIKTNKLVVYSDEHSILNKLHLTYLRKPKKLSEIVYNDSYTDSLELPEQTHEEVISLAAKIYLEEYFANSIKIRDSVLNNN